MLFRGQRRK